MAYNTTVRYSEILYTVFSKDIIRKLPILYSTVDYNFKGKVFSIHLLKIALKLNYIESEHSL